MLNEKRRREIEQLEVAKRQVASSFGWIRVEGTPVREFYARDQEGRLLWLKARTENYENMSWDGLRSDRQYDLLIGILVSPNGDVTTVIRVPKETVERLKHNAETDNPRLRWNDETRPQVEILQQSRSKQ